MIAPFRRIAAGVFASVLLLASSSSRADDAPASLPLPPRSQWVATASSDETPAMAPKFAIDGDPTTFWGGAFAAQHWLQVDLGSVAEVAGVLLHWDAGFAASYRIVTSEDGKEWQTDFETTDGQGGIDYVFFPAVKARYMRLASLPLSADWGVSVLEFEPLSASEAPHIEGLSKGTDPATVWGGSAIPPRALGPAQRIDITLPRPLSTTGLEVFWGAPWRSARLQGRDDQGKWQTLASDRSPLGDTSLLAARKPITATALRLTVNAARKPAAIRRLRLLPPDRTMTPLRRYEVVASRAHRELFPLTLRNQQVYWTVVGVPAGMQKSIFDEFGDLEAWKGAPMMQPLWRDSERHVHAAQGGTPTQSLREGWMPMPTVQWNPQPGLLMRSEAIAVESDGQPITLLRHRLQNTGEKPIEGELVLLIRPIQINPPWQSGGISPIYEVQIDGRQPNDISVRVDGRTLVYSLTPAPQHGASGFGARGEEELTQSVVYGAKPTAAKARDYDGLAAAYLAYPLKIPPGEKRDVVVAFPLGNKRMDVLAGKLPEAPPIRRVELMGNVADAGDAFDAIAEKVAQKWQDRVGRVGLTMPDRSVMDMLRAQVAYMMINQTGPAMQPGPRNYNRSYIRDGSATAAVLLRMGISDIARDYLHWYAEHAVHDNGLVSPILHDDGSVDRGYIGDDLEYDSQGEFVSFVADVARLDGGAQRVREYLPKVKLALKFLKSLRDRTLVPGYESDREAPERFRGIIAPSISHEGYSTPTHSYWDDYWALKGWHDGAWLASVLGDARLEAWARQQYAVLRESVAASIEATMKWKQLSTIPASADLGDNDPTSVSIGVDPCGQEDLMPAAALSHTFDLYLDDVRKRSVPGSLWAYTPYELRNVLTYVHLNRPADANELLTDLMRYRRPAAWQEFAEVVHSRLRHPGYLGDMPHTWIGAEYVRAIFGMLMHEADDHLQLLPGAPITWLAGEGVTLSELRTAYGRLTMTARQEGNALRVTLGSGLLPEIPVGVSWPMRQRPQHVIVDGQERTDQTADGIRLERPFKELVAQW
jgi:hypothetical protein